MDTTSLLPDPRCFLEMPTLTFHSTEAAFPAPAFDLIMVDSFQPVTPVEIVKLSFSHKNYNIFLHFPSLLTNFLMIQKTFQISKKNAQREFLHRNTSWRCT